MKAKSASTYNSLLPLTMLTTQLGRYVVTAKQNVPTNKNQSVHLEFSVQWSDRVTLFQSRERGGSVIPFIKELGYH